MKMKMSFQHKPEPINEIPFDLIEEKIDADWEPTLKQEYMILYDWGDGTDYNIIVGQFHSVWFGWNFHFFWGANSLQLSKTMKDHKNADWRRFKRVYKLIRHDSDEIEETPEFITDKDLEI